ncbi:MAG: alpha/beta hydrolase family protein [Bauldia sp.]
MEAETWTSTELSWRLDDTTIDGTLVMPAGEGPFPAVVMVAGSGPTDRDWNSPLLPGTNGSARLLAAAVADAGFASLRYDKRASGPRVAANMAVLAGRISMASHRDELAGAVRQLAATSRVRADRIFAVANSEGTLHALGYQAATPEVPLAGLVLIGPPGRPIGTVARSQIAAALATMPNRDALLALYDDAIARFVAGEPVTPGPALPEIARTLILGLTAPMNLPFARELWTADAAPLLRALDVPALVVIGRKDIQIDWRADGELLQEAASGTRDVTFLFPENADHVLKHELRPRSALTAADAAGYNAPDRQLDKDALDAIIAWLSDRA